MKGLQRYEQHLGIEVSNYNINHPVTKKPKDPSMGQSQNIYSQSQSASEPMQEQDWKATNRQISNNNKKRVQFAEESLESSIYDTHQVSEEADDSPLDH